MHCYLLFIELIAQSTIGTQSLDTKTLPIMRALSSLLFIFIQPNLQPQLGCVLPQSLFVTQLLSKPTSFSVWSFNNSSQDLKCSVSVSFNASPIARRFSS